jgi:6-pyruvoyltetrahydropterin/6-carboxytetrahydropterin synthase
VLWSLALFTISVETQFLASHQLTLPNGSKEPLHTHNWLVTVDVSGKKLNKMGLLMDFHRLKKAVDNITAQFGPGPLEKSDFFKQNPSSAEMVAEYIYQTLEPQLPVGVKLISVKVVEEPGFSAKFSKQ